MKISKNDPGKKNTRDNIKMASLPNLLEWIEASCRSVAKSLRAIEKEMWTVDLIVKEARKRSGIEPTKTVRVERFNMKTQRFEPIDKKEAAGGQQH